MSDRALAGRAGQGDSLAFAVLLARHRDRIGVPSELADAIGSLLVLYAAGADRSEEP